MLAPGMIRKMGKTYSDKRMTKDCRIHYQADAWSNSFIAFREPLPKHIDLEHDDVVEHDGFWSEVETNMNLHENLAQVWPVEIRPVRNNYKRLVRMSDGNGLTVWLDAGYLSAILKRQPTATFYTTVETVQRNQKGAPIVAKNGRPFAMVMPMARGIKSICDDSPWSVINDDLDAAREFDTANELAALLPARPGSKWHKVEHNGLSLEVRRSGGSNKKRELHVRMAGRDATSHISLYDGRGI